MQGTMPSPDPALSFATACLFTAAVAVTAFGLRRPACAGLGWWIAALWQATLGTAIGASQPGPLAAAVAAPLLLSWPLLALVGLRRFQARQRWPGHLAVDAVLIAVTVALSGPGSLLFGPQAATVTTLCGIVAQLYAALLIFLGPGGRQASPALGLGVTIGVVALAPGLVALGSGDGLPPLTLQAGAAAGGGLVLAFAALTLACERAERQLRESRRRLRTLANLDALSPVSNRRHFNELAAQALDHDPPGSAVLLLFDVDHLKRINDDLGHAAGDRALCLVSSSVLENLRAPDVAGRHAGHAFLLLLRRADTRSGMGVASRLTEAVQQRAAESRLPLLSLSFGLVQVAPDEDIVKALQRADLALYEAKRQGRSRAVAVLGDAARPVFSESLQLGLRQC
jgi:diguanylate cyclase (GGDEF)-like protein